MHSFWNYVFRTIKLLIPSACIFLHLKAVQTPRGNPKGGERESLDDLSPLLNSDITNNNSNNKNNDVSDTLSDRP